MAGWLKALLAVLLGGLVIAGIAWGLGSIPWMAWTPATGAFFIAIAGSLVLMTAWELAWPTVERQGWLPISTTRGDRFFIGLLGVAFIHMPFIAWGWTIGVADPTVWYALWPAWVLAVLWLGGVLWKG